MPLTLPQIYYSIIRINRYQAGGPVKTAVDGCGKGESHWFVPGCVGDDALMLRGQTSLQAIAQHQICLFANELHYHESRAPERPATGALLSMLNWRNSLFPHLGEKRGIAQDSKGGEGTSAPR